MGTSKGWSTTVIIAAAVLTLLPICSHGQTVSTVAISGTFDYYGSAVGPAADARFFYPNGITEFSSEFYILDTGNKAIKKLTALTAGTVSAAVTNLQNPRAILSDATTMHIIDDVFVKSVSGSSASTIAGNTSTSFRNDAKGLSSSFNEPSGMAYTSGPKNLLIADAGNGCIRLVDLSGQNPVTTVAGRCQDPGRSDGTGATAKFSRPNSIAYDGSSLFYVADGGVVRKMTTGYVVTTIATISLTLSHREYITASSNTLYLVNNGRVWKLDNLTSPEGQVYFTYIPLAVNVDMKAVMVRSGGTLLGVGGNAVVTIDPSTPMTYAPFATVSFMNNSEATYAMTTLAGTGYAGNTNGPAASAQFRFPGGLAYKAGGELLICDTGNRVLRQLAGGTVSTIVSENLTYPVDIAIGSNAVVYVLDSNTVVTIAGATPTIRAGGEQGFANANGTSAKFHRPTAMLVYDNAAVVTLLIADSGNSCIRSVACHPDNFTVTTFAGGCQSPGFVDATGTTARFVTPEGIARDGATGNVYVSDEGTVRKITSALVVTTLVVVRQQYTRMHLAFGNSQLYIAEGGTMWTVGNLSTAYPYLIDQRTSVEVQPRGITVSSGGNVVLTSHDSIVSTDFTTTSTRAPPPPRLPYVHPSEELLGATTVAGDDFSGYLDATGAEARFAYLSSIARAANGNYYVTDTGNRAIRQLASSVVTTLVAGLSWPRGLVADATSMYFADSSYIRELNPAAVEGSRVIRIAGNGTGFINNINGSLASFDNPHGMVIYNDGQRNLIIVDTNNACIRKVVLTGIFPTTTVAGSCTEQGDASGTGGAARFQNPTSITYSASTSTFWIADQGMIRKMTTGFVVSDYVTLQREFVRLYIQIIDSSNELYVVPGLKRINNLTGDANITRIGVASQDYFNSFTFDASNNFVMASWYKVSQVSLTVTGTWAPPRTLTPMFMPQTPTPAGPSPAAPAEQFFNEVGAALKKTPVLILCGLVVTAGLILIVSVIVLRRNRQTPADYDDLEGGMDGNSPALRAEDSCRGSNDGWDDCDRLTASECRNGQPVGLGSPLLHQEESSPRSTVNTDLLL